MCLEAYIERKLGLESFRRHPLQKDETYQVYEVSLVDTQGVTKQMSLPGALVVRIRAFLNE